jgi:methylated-DNA-protein-cysteine methyltransferase-like protein
MKGKPKVKTAGRRDDRRAPNASPTYSRFYAVVGRIPRGRVATYGQVAALAGLPGRARQVGYALHALPPQARLPWQRVINAAGRISPRSESGPDYMQRLLLAAEGVKLDPAGRIALADYQWKPRRAGKSGRRK